MAERIKCKPDRKPQVARAVPVQKIEPQSGSTDDSDSDLDSKLPLDRSPVDSGIRSPVDYGDSLEEVDRNSRRQPQLLEEPVDVDAEKYRPKKEAVKPADFVDTKPVSEPTGTILLEPITPPLEEIKAEPITPIYVKMRKPLKGKYQLTN